MKVKQTGFTIIELIVVIALIGILAAVALPRFINVQQNAQIAAVQGSGAAFSTAVALFRAQVIANGALGAAVADVNGYGNSTLDANDLGYPVGTDGGAAIADTGDCENIWDNLLQDGAADVDAVAGTGQYFVEFAGTTCTYTYEPEATSGMSIAYDAANGSVTIDSAP